jgi:C4-dicarboxylate-specific signal transduction histidine kinase
MVNLLVNAMQALDTVTQADKEIMCRSGLDQGSVVLEVSDNATGIGDEIKNSIFEPFFSTKQAGEGMGLGLSIVHTIVSGCNGEIRAGNNEKGGATFRLEFPSRKKDCGCSRPINE